MKMNSTDWIKSEPFLSPQAVGIGNGQTTHLDLKDADDAMIAAYVGAMAAGATLDLKLQETDDDPTGSPTWTDIANTPTALTQAGGDNDKLYLFEIDCRLRKRYVRVDYTVAVAAVDLAIVKQLTKPRERPVVHSANVVKAALLRNED